MMPAPRRLTPGLALRPVCLAVGLLGLHLSGHALPTGAQTVSGQVGVQSPGAGQLTVQQSSDKAIVDWKSFSIGAGERVLVNQPSMKSVLLNRVVGGEPSTILGQLQANGQVFLVNPRGIVFGKGSQIDAGGFLASTLGITNADFLSGRYAFGAGSETPGSLSADGSISAPGGTVALVSPLLSVGGDISAQRIGLASASSVRVDVEGDGLVLFDVRNDGLASRLDMLGRLRAEGGGSVELRAQARAGFADTVLNMEGLVQARSLGSRGGRVVIDGGTAGTTRVAGTVDATGAATGEQGGSVTLLGAQLALSGQAVVDVSGATGGGTAWVGGGAHGVGTEHNATDTTIAAGAVIRADAAAGAGSSTATNTGTNTGTVGDGGTVVVWSDRSTAFSGAVSARGGSAGGNGGFAEISGRQRLDFAGSVDLRPGAASGGQKGTLLLDPMDILIGTVADIDDLGHNQDLSTPTLAYNQYPGTQSRITAAQVVRQLDGANVRLEATHDITVQTAIDASGNAGGGSLTLAASNNVSVQANITTRGGDLTLLANQSFQSSGAGAASGTGAVNIDPGVQISTLGGGQTTGSITASGAAASFGSGSALFAGQDVALTTTAAGITLGQINAGGHISVQANGSIGQSAALTVGGDGSSFVASGTNAAIDLSTNANVFAGKSVALQSTGDAAISGDDLLLAASTLGGKLTATATGGNIAQTGVLTVGADGSSFTTLGVNRSIDLSTSSNLLDGKTIALQSTGNSAVRADRLTFGASTIGGKLLAAATDGPITQTGAITIGADGSSFTTTRSGQGIDLSTSVNAFAGHTVALNTTADAAITGDSLTLAASSIGGKLTATTTTGGMTQSGAVTLGADGSSFSTSASGASIDLSSQTNLFFGHTVSFQTVGSGGNVAVRADGLSFGASAIGGSLVATAIESGIGQTGAITLGADGSSFSTAAPGQAILLTHTGNSFNGKTVALQSTGDASLTGDALVLAASSVGGALVATATVGDITQTGPVTIGADGSRFSTAAGGRSVLLGDGGNLFTGHALSFQTGGSSSGGDVTIAGDGLLFGASTIGGKLVATATTGGIAQTGAITVGADGSSFSTRTANQAIALDSQANVFGGKTIALQTSGNAGDAAVRGDVLTFAASTVGGRLLATSTGMLTQTGALTVGGATVLTVGNGVAGSAPVNVLLDNAGNDFASIQVSAPGSGGGVSNVTVVDRNDLAIGGGPGVMGDLNARAGGSLILAGGSYARLEASAQTGISQTAALTVSGPTALSGAPGMTIDLASQGTANRLQTLTLAASGPGSLGAVQLANATDLTVGGDAASLQATVGGSLTLAGGRYGSLSVDTSAANGTVTQTGSLQVAGATRVAAGTGAVTLADPANDFAVFALAGAGDARVADANDLTIGDSFLAGRWDLTVPGNLRFGGLLSGSGSLALAGPGTALIDTAQTYTGGTRLVGGTLVLDGPAAQAGVGGTITVGAAGRLDLRNGASVANPVMSLGGMIANSAGNASITGPVDLQNADTRVDVATNSDLTISSTIRDGGAGIGLIKTGEGTLTLNTSNTFTGQTLISAGTVVISDSGSSTIAVASPVIVAAGTNLVLTQNQTLGPLTGTGNIFLGSFNLGIGAGTTSGSQANFAGSIAGSGNVTKLGDGLQILSGLNTYTGATLVAAGTLQVSGGAALADITAVSIAAGARLALGSSETIGSLSGAGAVQLGNQRLTTGANGADSVFSGAIDGSGGLTKVGLGQLLLSGSNGFTGDMVVAAGKLQLGSSTALSSVTGLAVAAGAEVDLAAPVRIGSLSGAGEVALQGHALDTGGDQRDTVYTGTLAGAGSLTKSGGGNFTLAGSNLYTGPTAVNGGSLTTQTALPAGTDLSVATGALLNLGTDQAFTSIAGSGRIGLNGHDLTVGASNADSSFDGGIEGLGNLLKLGSGNLVLGGLNSYAGSTTIQSGTLTVGAADTGGGSTRGTLGGGAVIDNATLRFQRSDATSVDNPISGSGQLVVASGTVTLTNAANGYTGATLVQGGELRTSAAERLPDASAVQVSTGARLTLAGAETVASISADGDVTVQGDVSTAGSQAYRGSLTVQAPAGMRFTATSLDAQGAANQLGSQPVSIHADTAQLTASQGLVLGDLQLANGGQITAPRLGLVGNLSLAQGRLGLTATAAPDPEAAVTDSMARVPGTGRPLAIAEATVTQGNSSAITVAAGAQLDIAATGGGSVLLAQDANSFLGGVSVLSGPAFNTAWLPNVQGMVGIQSQVQLAGGVVNVAGAGIEADVVNIRANQLATTGSAILTARLPFDNVSLGTSASLPSMLLELAPAAFQTNLPFGSSMTGIQVQIGSRMTGGRSTGMDAGYLTVRPKNGAQGATAVFLSGPNSSASIGGYRFFQDGAGRQTEIPVFYNNVLPQTPQVSGALSSVAAVAEAARKERFEETVRTENVAVRLRSGVIAEVGPGRPATVGTEGARPPVSCAPNKPNALSCD